MSDVALLVGLSATFLSIVVVGVVLELSAAERRKAAHLLSQVGSVDTELWAEESNASFLHRVIGPTLSGLRSVGSLITPGSMRDRIAHQLMLAGSPSGWDAEKVAALQVIAIFPGAALGWVVTSLVGAPRPLALFATAFAAFVGFMTPAAYLSHVAADRQLRIRRALPDTMDLLTISVEAGLGLNSAMAQVVKGVPGPLSQEISRMQHEMQIGVTRSEAFRHLGQRTDVEELQGFVLAMIQADTFGVSVGRVLRVQARELRVKRRQSAEESAQKLPIKILFPLIFCVLPALFVVVAAPGVIRIIKAFFTG